MLRDETPDNTVVRPEIWDKAGAGRKAYAEESAAADSAKKAYTLDIFLAWEATTHERPAAGRLEDLKFETPRFDLLRPVEPEIGGPT
jgi:hypothetical protein